MRRQSTFERYKFILRKYVLPAIGEKPLDQITRGEIRDLLLDLHGGGLSAKTIGLIRDVMSGPLAFAVDEEIIPVNPVSGVTQRLQLSRDRKSRLSP